MRFLGVAAGVCAAAFLTAAAQAAELPDPNTWRPLDPEQTLYIETAKGRIVVEMYPEIAPQAVARVKQLARERFYDGLTFHRVVDGFMAQGGDPLGNGEGGSKYPNLPDEFLFRRGVDLAFTPGSYQGGAVQGFYKALAMASQPDDMMKLTQDGKVSAWGLHCQGAAAMARAPEPDSANSQFYLMRAIYPSLDKRYTIWGRVVWGQDVVNALAVGEPPPIPDKMIHVSVASDVAEADRAPIYVERTDSKAFREAIKKAREKQKADFSVCNVPIPAVVPKTSKKGRAWWHKIPFVP
jgi:peptidylprolyl isomerase